MLRRISLYFSKKETLVDAATNESDEKPFEATMPEEKSVTKKCEELGLDYVMVRGVLRQLLDKGTVDELSYDSPNEKKRSDGMRFISENFSEMCKKANFDTAYKSALVETKGEILVLKAYL